MDCYGSVKNSTPSKYNLPIFIVTTTPSNDAPVSIFN